LSGGPVSGNFFNVLSTAPGTTTTVNGGPGVVVEFVIDDNAGTMNSIQGNLVLHGTRGASNFAVFYDYLNRATGLSYTLTATTLSRTGMAPISFDGLVETILYVPVVGGNQLNVQSVAPGVFANLTAANGDHDVIGSQAPALGGTMAAIQGPVGIG